MDERTDFTLVPRGPFSLAASTRFLEGFASAAYDGETVEAGADAHLDLAFPVEGDWRTVGVRVRQAGDGTVAAEVVGDADRDAVRAQVARILSLDVDGSGFPLLAERDPVVGRLQRRYPGLRPVTFWSPYEAAAWTVIGQRIRIVELPGIGPFASELILLRGAGDPDGFPGNERRMQRAMARAYGLEAQPARERLDAIADGWRPYRTWVSLLLRTELEDETHEIAGQRP
jgi:3-methyladenine DNA glycosylase/8-oxoguanine DNA glycosylase